MIDVKETLGQAEERMEMAAIGYRELSRCSYHCYQALG